MGWIERHREDFGTDLGDLLYADNNGTVTVSGGELLLTTLNGVDCHWHTSPNQLAPTIWREFSRYAVNGSGAFMVELRCTGKTLLGGDGNQQNVGMIIEKDPANYYVMWGPYWTNSDYFVFGHYTGDAWTEKWKGDWGDRYMHLAELLRLRRVVIAARL